MYRISGLAAFLCFNLLTSPAWCLDCANAKQPVDRLICNNPSLRKADTEMSKAYFDLLRSVKDPEIHQALVSSQQRWVGLRYIEGSRLQPDERKQEINLLRDDTAQRTRNLAMKGGVPESSALVANAVAQQRYVSRFSGGPYSGYWTECDFIPSGEDSHDYECFGVKAIQNAARVCSDYTYWASGRYYDFSKVANVSNGKLVTVAGCGGEDAQCPDDAAAGLDKGKTGWDFHVDEHDDRYNPDLSHSPVFRIDPDFKDEDDISGIAPDWMTQCLADPDFPPRSLESPATAQ
ncbi:MULTISPECIES: lysozyme inhibitor LprI family protein [Rhizobium]|jgi:uncharacterized protein YecT (DUF1311 family)|nr:lysozyme inhibitor LprI family protein [Rhizobium lusitanum]